MRAAARALMAALVGHQGLFHLEAYLVALHRQLVGRAHLVERMQIGEIAIGEAFGGRRAV